MKKRILAIFLTVLLALPIFGIPAFASDEPPGEAPESSFGSVNEQYVYAEGKTKVLRGGEEYPVAGRKITVGGTTWNLVDTLDELKKIEGSSEKFLIMNDIDLDYNETKSDLAGNWFLLNRKATFTVFNGVLDGNGYALTNASLIGNIPKAEGATTAKAYVYGLFQSGGTVKNLTFGTAAAPITIKIDSEYDGANISLINPIIRSSVTLSCHIENVNVYLDLSLKTAPDTTPNCYASAFCSRFYDGGPGVVTLKEVQVNGKITVRGQRAFAGGILGAANNATAASAYSGTINVVDCVNNADITSEAITVAAGYSYLGGIISFVNNYVNGVTVTGCVNNGTITDNTEITNQTGASYIGGVAGAIQTSNPSASAISGNSNSGSVNVKRLKGYSGGVFGYVRYIKTVSGCFNSGDVTANSDYVGGIIGDILNGEGVVNCANTGNINASKAVAAAGILAFNNGAGFVINRCFNTGIITTGNFACGIAYFTNANVSGINENYQLADSAAYGVYGLSAKKEVDGAVTSVTAGQLSSGYLAYRLGGGYGQLLGTDSLPVPGKTPYVSLDFTKEGEVYINTLNLLSSKETTAGIGAAVQFKTADGINKMRLILTAREENIDALGEYSIHISYAYGESSIKSITVSSDYLATFNSVSAAGEIFYAEYERVLFGVVISKIPAEVFADGVVTIKIITGQGTEILLGSAVCSFN